MKNTIVALLGLIVTLPVTAQESYTMKMSVKTEGLPAEYAAYGEQEIVTYLKGEKSKTEVSSAMFNSTVLYDGQTMTSLTDAMGNRSGFTATKAELEADNDKKGTKPNVEYTTEKRTIAGYECTKAIITSTDKDKKDNKITVWVTDKIKADNTHRRAAGRGMTDFGDLKGHPLAMEMTQNMQGMDMKIVMTTTEVLTTPIDDSVFNLDAEGYNMMSYKEMKEKAKAMGR